ncbi:hypothetical protein [Frateuria soli]|uniref:hypothetical protein n=1 Tax=Frateuria soli TaxID=1542730 RepID=UPI001E339000|nr:hypothetical protein [Frateuria soli]UGB38617.1 hypothetical protein LQ771_01820 [Frateuria soli]
MATREEQSDHGRHAGGGQHDQGDMTVREAGHKGGEIGGHKGGQRTRELIEEGKQAEGHGNGRK